MVDQPNVITGLDKRAPAPADKKEILTPLDMRLASLLDGMGSDDRKTYPLVSGCIDYFRDALLMVSHVSYLGNLKHNPGEPLHWARDKSPDESDALGRHLANRYGTDPDMDVEEAAQMCWRSLAFLQKLLETKYNILPPPGCA